MADTWYETSSEWNDQVYDDESSNYYTTDTDMYAAEEPVEENYHEEWYGDIDTYWARQDDWVHRDMLDEEAAEQLLEEESGYDEQMQQLFINYKDARDQLNQARRCRGFWPVVAIPSSDGGRASLAAIPPEPPRPPGKGDQPYTPKGGKGGGKKGGQKGKGKSKGGGKTLRQCPEVPLRRRQERRRQRQLEATTSGHDELPRLRTNGTLGGRMPKQDGEKW